MLEEEEEEEGGNCVIIINWPWKCTMLYVAVFVVLFRV